MKTSVTRELGILALDVFIALMLVVLACAFAGVVQELVGFRWLYVLWFAIGMLPFCFYARYRGVFQFDRWDILACLPFPIVVGIVGIWFHDPIVFMGAALVLLRVRSWIRGFLTKSRRRTTPHAR